MFKKKLFFILLSFIIAFSGFILPGSEVKAAPDFSACGGPGENPCQIMNEADLSAINADTATLGKSYVLAKDISLSGANWTPIGGHSTPFTGSFNGQNYKITGLKITTSGNNLGLFGKVQGGTIKNLTIEGAKIDFDTTEYISNVGILAGYFMGGTIENVNTFGTIIIDEISGGNYIESIGGLVGYHEMGRITDSHAAVNITLTGELLGTIGGFVGYKGGGIITGSTSAGMIHAALEKMGYPEVYSVGGLVGYLSGILVASHTTGDVSVTSAVYGDIYEVGGLVGFADDSQLRTNYATGNVTINSNGDVDNVGGLVGNLDYSTLLENSYALGNVTVATVPEKTVKNIGGIAGRISQSTVKNSFTVGQVSSTNSTAIGGLAGRANYPNADAYRDSITNTYWDKDNALSSVTSDVYSIYINAIDETNTLRNNVYGKTTSELKQPATFAGWGDFNTIWGIVPGEGYPYLKDNLPTSILLSELMIDSSGQNVNLTPAFNSRVLEYTVNVRNTSSVNVNHAAPPGTNVELIGNTGLSVGNNLVKVIAKSAKGEAVAYTINVNVAALVPELTASTAPGSVTGTTSVTAEAGTGNHLAVKVSSSSIPTPSVGDAAPAGAGVTDPYTSSSDISGVDAAANKYVGIYEIDGNNQVVAFKLITLTSSNIKSASNDSDDSGGSGGSAPPVNTPVASTNGKITVPVGGTGEVSLDEAVTVSVPTGATDQELQLTIEKVMDTANLVKENEVLVSPIFEILKNFSENFTKPVTLTFSFDSTILKDNQTAAVFYYDEQEKEWVEIGGTVDGNKVTAEVDHFTKFAVFAVNQKNEENTEEQEEGAKDIFFTDIHKHWAAEAVKQAVQLGIVKGYTDGTFKPDKSVTRAEFIVMLMNTLKPQDNGGTHTFTDKTTIGAWAELQIAQASQMGIITGYNDGSFRPQAEITRAEMVTIIARSLNLSLNEVETTRFADDIVIPSWAKGATEAVRNLGIVQGRGGNTFVPNESATRAEALTVMMKLLDLQK